MIMPYLLLQGLLWLQGQLWLKFSNVSYTELLQKVYTSQWIKLAANVHKFTNFWVGAKYGFFVV